MNDALLKRLSERRATRDALEAEIAAMRAELLKVVAEIGAYEDAIRLIGAPSEPPDPLEQAGRASAVASGAPGGLESRLSDIWRKLYGRLVDAYPDAVSSVDLQAMAAEFGRPLTSKQIRSVAWDHVNRGMLERVHPGVFRITARGAQAVNAKLPSSDPDQENGAADGEAIRTADSKPSG